MAQGFTDARQPIEHMNCRQDVRRIGALTPADLEKTLLTKKGTHGLKAQSFRVARDQACAKCG